MTGEFFDDFESSDNELCGADDLSFGEVRNYPWRTPYPYDGSPAPSPRRVELLGDMAEAWWADVSSWTEWAIGTFRLGRWFPSCWLRHPALVEEAQALWLLWSEAWLPGTEPHAPAQFLANLAAALQRIETLWQIPCSADHHIEPSPARRSEQVRPFTTDWWSLREFDPTAPVW